MYDHFSDIKFWSSDRNPENTMSHLYFNKDSDYSEENTPGRETKHIHATATDLLHTVLE